MKSQNIALALLVLISGLYLAVMVQSLEIGVRHFDGFQVLRAGRINTIEQYELLKSLVMSGDYDFWLAPALGGHADVMVASEQLPNLTSQLQSVGLEFKLQIPDVERVVAEERASNERALRAGAGQMNWNAYQRWAVIEPWIQSFAVEYPGLTETSVIGQTYEGRSIYMVKVSTGKLPNGENKKAILLDANIHAREWIAGATGSWILNELVTNSDNYADILEKVDFYIIPYLNIDGYEYTHTVNRMWRKTRRPNAASTCRGADPNRNFGFHFGGEMTSPDPCTEIYHGGFAFSQPETAALRDTLHALQEETTVAAYITLHSYGQLWLLSWGYTQGVYPEDYNELLDWGRSSVSKIKEVDGRSYTTGQGADLLYGVGGASDDYAKSEGVKYSTTAELRDTETYGFLLPSTQIESTARETFAGVLNTARYVMALP